MPVKKEGAVYKDRRDKEIGFDSFGPCGKIESLVKETMLK